MNSPREATEQRRSPLQRLFSRLPVDPDLPSPPRPGRPRALGLAACSAVGLGGALGTLARYELSLAWPTASGAFPTTILLVNLSGAFVIGLVLSALLATGHGGMWRLFSCVGVLGGWTTMSSLAVGADELLAHGHVGAALVDLVVSVVAGGLATAAGIGCASALFGGASEEEVA